MSPIDVTLQFVIVARLGDFCKFSGAVSGYESDPWLYMRGKLRELEGPLQTLKQQQLSLASAHFQKALAAAAPSDEALSEFRMVLDRYLAPGDFVDAAFYLNPQDLSRPNGRKALQEVLGRVKPHSLFDEERKPAEKRSKTHEKLVGELWTRLGLDRLESALSRKPRTPRRQRMALRRLRRNVAEYCSVLHLPMTPEDTFSPFMLHRVEALMVGCLRLLDKYR